MKESIASTMQYCDYDKYTKTSATFQTIANRAFLGSQAGT